MSERGVAHVVRKAGSAYYRSYLWKQRACQFGLAFHQGMGYVVAQRHAHAGHLKAVGEAVVDEDAARKRKHLGLVLHTAERGREYKPVVVALEFRAVVVADGVTVLLPEPLI